MAIIEKRWIEVVLDAHNEPWAMWLMAEGRTGENRRVLMCVTRNDLDESINPLRESVGLSPLILDEYVETLARSIDPLAGRGASSLIRQVENRA